MENISARLDSYLKALENLDKQPGLPLPMNYRILKFHLDFRFLKLFSKFIINCAAGADDQNANLDSIKISIEALLKKRRTAEERANLASDVLPRLENLKTKIKEICDDLWVCSMKAVSSGNRDEIKEFMDLVLWNLRDFVNLKGDLSAPLKNQIRVLQEKLCFVGNLFDFTAKRCSDRRKLEEFWSFMQGVMNSAACLSVMYWTDENQVARWDSMLADLLRKTKTYNLMVIKMYFGVLLSSRPSLSEKFETNDLVMSLYDSLLEDLVSLVKDRFEVFRAGLVFLTTFLMNPPDKPEREAGDVLLMRTDDVINDVAYSVCAIYMVDIDVYIPPEVENVLLGAQGEIDKVMAEIREVHAPQIPNFSCSDFPVTNEVGFIDCLLGNLEEIMKSKANGIPFAREKIMSIQQELLSIRAFLKDVMELKIEQQEVKDLWKRMINVAYHAELVVKSCFVVDTPIWYDMLSLSIVAEELKVIKMEVQKITDLEMYRVRKPDEEYHSGCPLPRLANTPRIQEVFVGFKDEIQRIIDRLTRGTKGLDIISIVGMPGQGKTTLAKKVYNHPSVKHYFRKCAWCYVSQVYQTKELLLDILSCIIADHDIRTSHSNTCEDELADLLRKSLKGQRFFIVMDDIWDIETWDGIKRSLPDDGIGSRIIFTSRMHNLVLQAKPNCNPHPIRPLSDEESWVLLQERLFYNANCPSELSEIGKKIASKCKGLPLAVVLVAGILARKDKNLESWNEIMGTMGSHSATEGCRDLIELSYKHLPDSLRPCLLYFGAFEEDKMIRVPKLIKLWIAEGFVPRNSVKQLDEMARGYLMDLIDRSLVTIAARSSMGEVKACGVHDLLHEFCLTKAREERFLHKFCISDNSPKIYDQYRLCIDASKWKQFMDSRPAVGRYVHSLVVSGVYEERGKSSRLGFSYAGFKFLHVLDMELIYSEIVFPEEITLMVHLRYFAVWFSSDYLPSSIANLWNLETLIVNTSNCSCALPNAIWTMNTLRHIQIPHMEFKDESYQIQLHNVGSLSAAILTSEKDAVVLSRTLPRLRKLKILSQILWHGMDPIPFPDLTSLSLLESLSMYSPGLFMREFTSFYLPNTLRKLTLRGFCLRRDAISTIGKLPNLQVLKLRTLIFFDQTWDLEDGEFSNLKFLELWITNLRHWNDCSEPFPCLERLVLKNCDHIEEIPPSFADIPTLKRMDVHGCPKASSSAKEIVEHQRDMENYDLEFYIEGN